MCRKAIIDALKLGAHPLVDEQPARLLLVNNGKASPHSLQCALWSGSLYKHYLSIHSCYHFIYADAGYYVGDNGHHLFVGLTIRGTPNRPAAFGSGRFFISLPSNTFL